SRPLDPRYISSVDSGNLAGHLIAVSHACREMIGGPRLDGAAMAGIDDTVQLVRQSAGALADVPRGRALTRGRLASALDAVAAALHAVPASDAAWAARLAELDA